MKKQLINKKAKSKNKALSIFATMVGMVDGFFGASSTDKMMRDVIDGKDNDEILFDTIKRRRENR